MMALYQQPRFNLRYYSIFYSIFLIASFFVYSFFSSLSPTLLLTSRFRNNCNVLHMGIDCECEISVVNIDGREQMKSNVYLQRLLIRQTHVRKKQPANKGRIVCCYCGGDDDEDSLLRWVNMRSKYSYFLLLLLLLFALLLLLLLFSTSLKKALSTHVV